MAGIQLWNPRLWLTMIDPFLLEGNWKDYIDVIVHNVN